MMVTSIFSFSHKVFKRLFFRVIQKNNKKKNYDTKWYYITQWLVQLTIVWNICNSSMLLVNYLPHDTITNWTKFKAFADDKLNTAEVMFSDCNRIENIMEKEKKLVPSNFLLLPKCFPQYFQKPSSSFKSHAWVAQWWVCQTHDQVVVSSFPAWGDFSFRCIFTSHLCRSMWEK